MLKFDGLGMNLGNLPRLSKAKTRSISAENPTGEKGKGGMATEGFGAPMARDLGQGWKISPAVRIEPGKTFMLANIEGSGAIQSIWLGRMPSHNSILRIYWDGQAQPSVECPVGNFFASGWDTFAQLTSIPVAVNPNRGFNCFWVMPFRKSCRVTIENCGPENLVCFYQVNYILTDIPDDIAYFHAQFRRVNPLPYREIYTIVDGIEGSGQYIGTYLAWGLNNGDWWGEGEIKFYIDDDKDFPTICGTGTEDYFGGAFNWEVNGQYVTYSTPFMGMHQIIQPDGLYKSQQRFSLYRWHIMDPIRFERSLRVTIQALGWRSEHRYLPRQDDIASVAFWYQTLPTAPFPELPSRDYREVI